MIFENSSQFSMYIEQFAQDNKMSIIDAILEYCQQNFLEPKDVAPLINKTLKDKLEKNYQELGMLPETPSLDSYFE